MLTGKYAIRRLLLFAFILIALFYLYALCIHVVCVYVYINFTYTVATSRRHDEAEIRGHRDPRKSTLHTRAKSGTLLSVARGEYICAVATAIGYYNTMLSHVEFAAEVT